MMRLLLLALTLAAQSGSLKVEVTGAKPAGKVVVSVCDAEQFRRRSCPRQASAAPGGAVSFEGVPHGRYIVTAYQDVNGNGRMDENALGIPTEPAGLSGPQGAIPNVAKAVIRVGPEPMTVRIVLR